MPETAETAATAEQEDLRTYLLNYFETATPDLPKPVDKARKLKEYTFEVPAELFKRIRTDMLQSKARAQQSKSSYEDEVSGYTKYVNKHRAVLTTGSNQEVVKHIESEGINHIAYQFKSLKETTYWWEVSVSTIEALKELNTASKVVKIASSPSISDRLTRSLKKAYQDILNSGDVSLIQKYLKHIHKFDMVDKYNKQLVNCSIREYGTADTADTAD